MELRPARAVHPTKEGTQKTTTRCLGCDDIKDALVDELTQILDRERLAAWSKKHHPHGLGIVAGARSKAPLILLSGDVGCGKTALASCVASAVAKAIDHRIACLETPSDHSWRRAGGGLSTNGNVTEAFTAAQRRRRIESGRSILVIDPKRMKVWQRAAAARCRPITKTARASTC